MEARSKRRAGRLAWLLLPALLAAGCASHPRGECGRSCPDIESATNMKIYHGQRLILLDRIAARPGLTQHEQEYLVNAVFMGGYGDNMADALVTLMKNPASTQETRDHIRQRLRTSRMTGRAERRIIENLSRYDARDAAGGGPATQPAAPAGAPATRPAARTTQPARPAESRP